MMGRPPPDPLTADEDKALLALAEQMWADLQANRLGGYSDGNRPFWIKWQIERAIEQFGRRDVGLTWTKPEMDAARKRANEGEGQ